MRSNHESSLQPETELFNAHFEDFAIAGPALAPKVPVKDVNVFTNVPFPGPVAGWLNRNRTF